MNFRRIGLRSKMNCTFCESTISGGSARLKHGREVQVSGKGKFVSSDSRAVHFVQCENKEKETVHSDVI